VGMNLEGDTKMKIEGKIGVVGDGSRWQDG